jgi:hypothetical protein
MTQQEKQTAEKLRHTLTMVRENRTKSNKIYLVI